MCLSQLHSVDLAAFASTSRTHRHSTTPLVVAFAIKHYHGGSQLREGDNTWERSLRVSSS
jgi:hypothetical protein